MTRSLSRILYVEDDLDIQEVAKIALEEIGGFTVKICNSGLDAVEAAPGFMPEFILLDVMMPGMDGPSTLVALRELEGFNDIPVVFMTAKVMDGEVKRYRDMGAADVIAKPFDPMTLSDRIREIWQGLQH